MNTKAFDKIQFCLKMSATDEEFIGLLTLFGYGKMIKELAA